MTQPNRVAHVVTSILAAAAGGAAAGTVFTWLSWTGWPILAALGDPRNLVFAGNFVIGPAVGAWLAWSLGRGVEETWRRAAITVTGGLGAFGGSWAAFPVSMYALMVSSDFLTKALVPGYFFLNLIIWFFTFRMARKQQAMLTQSGA